MAYREGSFEIFLQFTYYIYNILTMQYIGISIILLIPLIFASVSLKEDYDEKSILKTKL